MNNNKRCPLGHQHNDYMRATALVHTHVWLNVAAFENPECSNYNYITTTAMSIINTRNKCELTTCQDQSTLSEQSCWREESRSSDHHYLRSSMKQAIPASILVNIVLEHFKKASSTFSPVNALVSKNISSNKN